MFLPLLRSVHNHQLFIAFTNSSITPTCLASVSGHFRAIFGGLCMETRKRLKVILLVLTCVSSRRNKWLQNLPKWYDRLENQQTAQVNIALSGTIPWWRVKQVVAVQQQWSSGQLKPFLSIQHALKGCIIMGKKLLGDGWNGMHLKAAWCAQRLTVSTWQCGLVVATGAVPTGEGRSVRGSHEGNGRH